jgi:ribosomal protein S18 acetylase RimI-like enzyme
VHVGTDTRTIPDIAERAVKFRRAQLAAVCDVQRPWAHGTVMRASGFPTYFHYNLLRVEDDPGMTVSELTAATDEALAGLSHRRIDFERADAAEPLRAEFHAAGWRSVRLLWMRHDGSAPPQATIAIEQVPYDEAAPLREAWHEEDFHEQDPAAYHEAAREVAMRRDVRVLVASEGGEPVGFVQVERVDESAEVASVYVSPEHRGGGRGTALTCAGIEAAADVEDLWIVADDEDRPKDLYARLGFQPARRMTELTLWPK